MIRQPVRPIPVPDPIDWGGVILSGGGAAGGDQFRPAITTNGRDFFAVWSDRRDGLAQVYGARVASDGTLLDTHGILIGQAPVESYDVHAVWRYESPSVAFDGTNYVVVWSDARTGTPSVYLRRVVAATGVPLEADAVPLTPGLDAVEPQVAASGSQVLVTYSAHLRRYFDDGRPADQLKLFGLFFDPAVREPGAFPLTIVPEEAAWESQARIATDGTGFMVAFTEWFANPQPDVFVVPVSSSTRPVATGLGYAISTFDAMSAGMNATTPSIAFDGSNYLVAFARWGSIFGVRVAPAGTAIDSWYGIPLSHGPGSNPSASFNGTDVVVAWDRETYAATSGVSNVFGARVSPAGGVSPSAYDYYFGLDSNQQQHPAIAATPAGELVVWQELAAGDWDIRGTTVTPGGSAAKLDGQIYSLK